MRHPPSAKLPHHSRFARHWELFRPLTILPSEIFPQTIFEVTLSPGGLKILLSLCSVIAVQASFPVQQFKRNPASRRGDSTGIMLLQTRRQVVGQSALGAILNSLTQHYLNSTTLFEFDGVPGGAPALLKVLQDGMKLKTERLAALKRGELPSR